MQILAPQVRNGCAVDPTHVVLNRLTDLFHIVNETTRESVENPALRALKDGVIVGLANHTILIARDGTERPIDDSAAPIRTADGNLSGVVLVFRDITDRKKVERQMAELLALESERSHRLRRIAAASLTLNSATSASSVVGVIREEARQIIGANDSYLICGYSAWPISRLPRPTAS